MDGLICVCRCIVAYAILSETENRTLEEIEAHFSDRSIRFTDTHIKRIDGTVLEDEGATPKVGQLPLTERNANK